MIKIINNTKKILYLLDVLRKTTQGYSSEINKLYLETVKENHAVKELTQYINEEYLFYKGMGKTLSDEAESLLRDLERKPDEVLQTIRKIELKNDMINHQAKVCENLLCSPLPTLETITIIKKKEFDGVLETLRIIASTCVYLILLYNGPQGTKNLTWSDDDGVQEQIYKLNTKFLPAIKEMAIPEYSWVVEKKKLGGCVLIGDEGYVLSYKRTEDVEKYCSSFIKEPMGTHAFLNVTAYEKDELNVPICWGTGNILSVSPNIALEVLRKGVVQSARSPFSTEYERKMPAPLLLLKTLYNGQTFCATPETLVSLMNQWTIGNEISIKRRNRCCIFCGKAVSSSEIVCRNHFTSEF